MKKIDYLIIGQGIAGSLLAHFLLKKGKIIRIADKLNPNSSSLVAAGIFNPITGRRFVKTWLADDIFPFAQKVYREIENEFGEHFYFPKKIIRTLSDESDLMEWEKKSRRSGYIQYLSPTIEESLPKKVEVKNGGNVDLLQLIKTMRINFRKMNLLLEEKFNYQDLMFDNEAVNWTNYRAEKIIFCEGINAMQNPWFGQLPFTHTKGEILTVKSKELKQENILSKGIFILPVGNDLYKVGSTYNWDDLSEIPTEKGRLELIKKLEKIIDCDYTIVDHQAGIRPTVKDRRPLIGLHSEFPQLGIFNGLGTKGVSLGPYFANQFVDYLEDDLPLNSEVDIKRFLEQD